MHKSNRLNREGQRRAIGIAISALLVLIAAVLVLAGGDGGEDDAAAGTDAPHLVDAEALAELADTLGHSVYWAGERPPDRIELARQATGNVFVRYLPEGAEAGDPRAEFLTVGTYPLPDPVAALERTAAGAGVPLRGGDDGARILVDPSTPDSVYLAYPDTELQIEVYDPAGGALELVEAGEVEPAG